MKIRVATVRLVLLLIGMAVLCFLPGCRAAMERMLLSPLSILNLEANYIAVTRIKEPESIGTMTGPII